MIELKKLKDIEDFKKIPDLQKSAWGFLDIDIEPHHLMTRVQKYGGLVQGLISTATWWDLPMHSSASGKVNTSSIPI